MTKSRSQSIKSSKSNKSRAHSITSVKNAYKELKSHGLAAIPTRYYIVLVALMANTFSYTCRTNMSVTIVAMVNDSVHHSNVNNTDKSDTCIPSNSHQNQTYEKDDQIFGEFLWSGTLQGHILGAFYYGYIATNINGGQLAQKFGVRWLCGFVTMCSGILTALTPVVAKWNPIALIILRVVTGLAQGILTPAIYELLAHWIPRHERGVVLALIQVGGNIGAVLTLPVSGFLSNTNFLGGWPSVFYVLGLCGILSFLSWIYCIYDTPETHPRIKGNELIYIQENVTVSLVKRDKKEIPWIPIFLSLPMWAIAVAKFCGAWGNLMLMSKLPAYLESVMNMPIEMNGVISATVYIALSISLTFFGFVSDYVGKKNILNETLSRKIFETIALGGPGICLAFIPLIGCNQTLVIFCLVLGLTIFGLNAGGDKPAVIDIAPDHSGTIYGITNAIASLPGILAPLYVGMIVEDQHGSLSKWNIVFYSTTGVYIFGALFFIIFGTAKAQPWGISESRSRRCTTISKRNSVPASKIHTPVDHYFEGFQFNQLNVSVITGDNENYDFSDEEDDGALHFKERRFSIFPIS